MERKKEKRKVYYLSEIYLYKNLFSVVMCSNNTSKPKSVVVKLKKKKKK